MISEILQNPKYNARGKVANVIKYLFKLKQEALKTKENVSFIGASDSLCMSDPLHSFLNKGVLNQQPDLSYLIEKFEAMEHKNTRVKQPYLHIVLSLRENEALTKSQWHALVSEYVSKMGYTDHHWISVEHANTKNRHAHVLISCIGNTAPHKKLKDSNNFQKSALIRDELEQKYGLQHDNNPFVGDVCEKVNNASYKTKNQLVRDAIDVVMPKRLNEKGEVSLPSFIDGIVKQGLGCHVQLRQGEVLGLSFSLGGATYRASKLGQGYSWPNLVARGVFYDKALHQESVERSNAQERKITTLMQTGFQNDLLSKQTPNQHYLLVPNEAVKRYPMDKKLHRYNAFNLWFPVQTQGKTKQQIESDIIQMRTLRILLQVYFEWLHRGEHNSDDKTVVKLERLKAGFSSGLELKGDNWQVNALVKHPKYRKVLNEHGCLLVSKAKLQGGSKNPVNVPSSGQEMTFI